VLTEALSHFIQSILWSMLLHTNKTAKDKCTPLEFSITTCFTRGYAFRIQHYDGCL